jgi:hypothetical protein
MKKPINTKKSPFPPDCEDGQFGPLPKTVDRNKILWVDWFDDHFYEIGFADGTTQTMVSYSTIAGIISNPFFSRWRGKLGNEEADRILHESADAGSRVHHAWYVYVNNGAVLYRAPWNKAQAIPAELVAEIKEKYPMWCELHTQEEQIQVHRLKRWMQEVKPTTVASEMTVFSPSTGVAGTLDTLFGVTEGAYKINGREPLELQKGLTIVDIKTGSSAQTEDVQVQLGVYAQLLEESYPEFGKVVQGLMIKTQAQTRTGIEGLSTTLYNREQLDQGWEIFQPMHKLWQWKHESAIPKRLKFPAIIAHDIGDDDVPAANAHGGSPSKIGEKNA